MNKAVFLDRDGTLNYDYGYIKDPERLDLFSNVEKSLNLLRRYNFKLILVSNQSGVARGYMDISQVRLINKCLEEKLAEFNISLDGIYFCPHHKEGKIKRYTKDCSCRKPKPGLLLKAKEEHNLDLRSSFLIGDKISDIGAGFNAGCKTILVLTGFGKEELEKKSLWEYHPDYIAEDLFQAVCWIINNVNEDKRT